MSKDKEREDAERMNEAGKEAQDLSTRLSKIGLKIHPNRFTPSILAFLRNSEGDFDHLGQLCCLAEITATAAVEQRLEDQIAELRKETEMVT